MQTSTRAGFSLVEVCLALGIAAFCLVAIFALLPIGLRGNLESSEETMATGILSQVAADLTACPATKPRGQATNTAQFAIAIPANPVTTESVIPARYFSESGYDGTTRQAGSQYRVDVTFLTNSATNAATMAYLKASWPAAASQPTGKVETVVALDRN
jgi:uncharacterized protein (TIGR02598 family)